MRLVDSQGLTRMCEQKTIEEAPTNRQNFHAGLGRYFGSALDLR